LRSISAPDPFKLADEKLSGNRITMPKNDITGLYLTNFDILDPPHPLLNCDIYPYNSQSDNYKCIVGFLCILYYTYFSISIGLLV
jgi:hypothetical protein